MIECPMHRAGRCGAKTRKGTPCEAPAIRGKTRCRMHGGKSPGRPQIHGRYAKANIEKRRSWRRLLRELRQTLHAVEASHRPKRA
jgi:hypothetical protein